MTVENSTVTREKSYLRIPEIAEDLDVSVGLANRWVREGKLEGTRLGKQPVRVRRDVLERFLEDCTEGGIW